MFKTRRICARRHHSTFHKRRDCAADAGPGASTTADRLGKDPDQDDRSRQQDLHAGRAGREYHRRGRHRRHHHGGRPVRAALRQDQGRDQGDLAATGQISGQHALSTAITLAGTRTSPRTASSIVAHDNIRVRLAGRHEAGSDRRDDRAAPGRRAAEGDLFRRRRSRSKSAAARRSSLTSPTPIPTATPGSISPTPTCSATGDTVQQPQALSEHRLRQWRRRARHDPRDRHLSQGVERQHQDRAGPRAARHQADIVDSATCW